VHLCTSSRQADKDIGIELGLCTYMQGYKNSE
jgi:hypothetical protein